MRSWEKFAPSFSLAGSLTLFAAVFSGRKPQRIYPYIIASVILHIGLLTLLPRMTMKKQPPEPIEVELVIADPPTPEPPSFLPPGDEGTSPTVTKNRGPESPSRSPKKAPGISPRSPYAPHERRIPAPTPKIPIGNLSFDKSFQGGGTVTEDGMIPMPAIEGIGGTTQNQPPAETVTPLSQLPSQLYEGQSAMTEDGGGGGRGVSQFGRRIVNRIKLDKKKKHYQIVFLVDASGSMIYKINLLQQTVHTIIHEARAQIEEGGHVTLALWVYMGSAAPVTSLTPEPEFANTSNGAEMERINQALEKAAEFIEEGHGGYELTWDASMEALRREPFSESNETEKILFVITDDEASWGMETAGDESCEKVKVEARRRGVRYEVIRSPNE